MGKKIQTLVELAGNLVSRARSLGRLGYQYGGDRDIYKALGYKLILEVDDYLAQYTRQDMAKAIINKPVGATWRGTIAVVESNDPDETDLEKSWKELESRLSLKSMFARLDRLVSLEHYGVLLLGLNDVSRVQDFAKPVVSSEKRELLYVKPLMEASAKIHSWELDTKSARYGLPILYQITIQQSDGGSSNEIMVHHSRVLHVAGEELLENELYGVPKLEVVFNRLKDLEKLVGGSAEMFWRGARPGYQAKVDSEYQMTPETKADLQDQVDEYENNLRRILINEGIDLQALAQQVADPSKHVDVQIQMISAVTGIPKRILTGSERGELASTEDKGNWLDTIQTRREEYAEPRIVRPFVDKCIEYGVLPEPKERYTVQWASLWEQSEKSKAEVGKIRAIALKDYGSVPTNQDIIPPKAFLKLIMNLDDDQIELIEKQQEEMIKTEEDEFGEGEGEGRRLLTQAQVDQVDWKKVYEDGGAHWMEDLQPSRFAQRFAERMIAEQKHSVLEIGCANGKDSILFAVAGIQKVIGIDIVPEAIVGAKENADRTGVDVTFQEGDGEDLSFSDASFDAVYSLSVLHSTDMEKSFSEIVRVLKPNGIVGIFIYSDVQRIDGSVEVFISVDEYIDLLKSVGLIITDFHMEQDQEYDEGGEKHSIIMIEAMKG